MSVIEIRRRVSNLLQLCSIIEPPVDVEVLAESQGFMVVRMPWDTDLAAALIPHGPDGAVIGINKTHSRTRQRFSIGHELGHAFLHTKQRLHYDLPEKIFFRTTGPGAYADPTETEANRFSAELLMPQALLRRDFESLSESEFTAAGLARRYGVSEIAMSYRLTNLGMGGTQR